jgi:hypothetical protein
MCHERSLTLAARWWPIGLPDSGAGLGHITCATHGSYAPAHMDPCCCWQALMAWQRVRAANLLAGDGEQWAQVVAMHSSGGCCTAPAPALRLRCCTAAPAPALRLRCCTAALLHCFAAALRGCCEVHCAWVWSSDLHMFSTCLHPAAIHSFCSSLRSRNGRESQDVAVVLGPLCLLPAIAKTLNLRLSCLLAPP